MPQTDRNRLTYQIQLRAENLKWRASICWRRKKYEIQTDGIHGLYPLPRRCRICNNLSPYGHPMSRQKIKNDLWLNFSVTEEMITQTDDGCPFCALVLQVLKHYATTSSMCSLYIKPGWPVMLRPWIPEQSQTHGKTECIQIFRDINTKTSTLSMVSSIGPGAILFNHANDPGIYDFITNCIQECGIYHSKCLAFLHTQVPLPTRVIELNGPGCACRLVESQPSHRGKYAALSYFWGTGNPLKTTKAVLETHKKEILWDALPQLFQDVAEVVYRLGIIYVWIDALCIVQDDKDDWEIQAQNMANIYQNAEVTIVAASSPNPETSLFANRSPHKQAVAFDLVNRDGSSSSLHTRPIMEEDLFQAAHLSPKDFQARTWTEPIYTRGWCFQEDLLSQHAIHYLPSRVVWECRMLHRDERQLPRYRSPPGQKRVCKGRRSHFPQHSYVTQEKWWDYVTTYTARNLTFNSDRLPAMSGIANIISSRSHDIYLAGLWRSSLVRDLGWVNRYNSAHPMRYKSTKPPDQYLAPSWSWASLESGQVLSHTHVNEIFELLSTYVDASVTLKGHNKFGEVTDGFIKLGGPFCAIRIVYDFNGKRLVAKIPEYPADGKEIFSEMTPDTALCIGQGLLDTGDVVPTVCRGVPDEAPGDSLIDAFPNTYMMLLFTALTRVTGLALGRSSRVPGAYERLGHIYFSVPDLEGIMQATTQSTITLV